MSEVILYGLSRSVYTRIFRLVLEEKDIVYTLEEVEIFGKEGVPKDYLSYHPFGKIPTLIHNDFCLYETNAIIRYIDDAFSGIPLQPTEIKLRARMHQVISVLDSYGYRPMIWPVFVERISVPRNGGVPNEVAIKEAVHKIFLCLQTLEKLLAEQEYFVGDELTLADLHAAPILFYFAQTPEGETMLVEFPFISGWLKRIEERRSVINTRSIYGC